jgi:hypothetical protein
VEVDFFLIGRLRHRIGDGKVHDILYRLREVVRVGVHPLENMLMTAAQTLAEFLTENVQVAEQDVNRRAEFMGEIGERFQMYSLFPIFGPRLCARGSMRRDGRGRFGPEYRI